MLYHFTDETSSNAIRASGYLRASSIGVYGAGVYFTALNPWNNSRTDIAFNNWASNLPIDEGKTDYIFQIGMERNMTEKVSEHWDIYIHRDNLFLNGTLWFKLWYWSRETGDITPTGFQSQIQGEYNSASGRVACLFTCTLCILMVAKLV